MRVSKRHHQISIAQTELEIALDQYCGDEDLTYAVLLQRIAGLKVKITREMRREKLFIPDPARGTKLDWLVYRHAMAKGMTQIEIMQALTSFEQTCLKYMLRYERHGNYETPAARE